MTEVEITDGHLRVVVKGFDKVLALRSTLEVPPLACAAPHKIRTLSASGMGCALGAPHSPASSRRVRSTTGGGGS